VHRETKSFVVTLFDSGCADQHGFWHWTSFNIPPTITSLPAGADRLPAREGRKSGYTDFDSPLRRPCPPNGDQPHHYMFHFYARHVPPFRVSPSVHRGKYHVLPAGPLLARIDRRPVCPVVTNECNLARLDRSPRHAWLAVTLAAMPSRMPTHLARPADVRRSPRIRLAISNGGPPGFSIEQVLSVRFPPNSWPRPRRRVAWVFDSAGARNIWVAAPPSYAAHRVTSYTEMTAGDHQCPLALGGHGLVYVRGGDANAHGEIGNPALIPSGVEQAV